MIRCAPMGSVRRSNWKGYLPFLALNAVVSLFCVLLVLALWNGARPSLPELPTPTFDVDARVAIAVPTATATIPPSPTPLTYTARAGDTPGGWAGWPACRDGCWRTTKAILIPSRPSPCTTAAG